LRGNLIVGVMEDVVAWLVNSSRGVVNLDLRGNPGYNESYHKEIICGLLRNIKELKSDPRAFKSAIQRGWISKELMNYKVVSKTIAKPEIKSKEKVEYKKPIKVMTKIKQVITLKKSASSPKLNEEDRVQCIRSISCYGDFGYKKNEDCKRCGKYFKELMESESRYIGLVMEVKQLRNQLHMSSLRHFENKKINAVTIYVINRLIEK
jgi:hypothetical protein